VNVRSDITSIVLDSTRERKRLNDVFFSRNHSQVTVGKLLNFQHAIQRHSCPMLHIVFYFDLIDDVSLN